MTVAETTLCLRRAARFISFFVTRKMLVWFIRTDFPPCKELVVVFDVDFVVFATVREWCVDAQKKAIT